MEELQVVTEKSNVPREKLVEQKLQGIDDLKKIFDLSKKYYDVFEKTVLGWDKKLQKHFEKINKKGNKSLIGLGKEPTTLHLSPDDNRKMQLLPEARTKHKQLGRFRYDLYVPEIKGFSRGTEKYFFKYNRDGTRITDVWRVSFVFWNVDALFEATYFLLKMLFDHDPKKDNTCISIRVKNRFPTGTGYMDVQILVVFTCCTKSTKHLKGLKIELQLHLLTIFIDKMLSGHVDYEIFRSLQATKEVKKLSHMIEASTAFMIPAQTPMFASHEDDSMTPPILGY